ncbi:MAG TPA: M4 family metallopeptidase, partial [Kineosporiaceae bacterium]|nr:M4 family metallopeptidase [Kineosporiaceae bacterium]
IGTEWVPPAGDADATAAYDFAGDAYDYFWTEQGRDGYSDKNDFLRLTVHYCPTSLDCPYKGAFGWGSQLVFGEGWSRADDIVTHELTHLIIANTAELISYKQSGALAEAFADMFGETVDQWNTGRGDQARRGTDTAAVRWLIGEDLPGGAIRNMMNPNQFGDPGKTSDPQYRCGSDDDGSLHSNAGVPNHAYALMVDGGTYNGVTVAGIGLRKAARIQYRTLTGYTTAGSDFMDYYDAVQLACDDLIAGPEGITAADCVQVQRALDAVQIAAPALCSQAVEPDVCPAGKVASDLFFDDFESGSAKWKLTQPVGSADARWMVAGNYVKSGSLALLAYAWWPQLSDARAEMAAPVTIPAGDVRLRFDHAYDLDGRFAAGAVEYTTDGGTTWLDAGSLFFSQGKYGGAVPNSYVSYAPLSGRYAFLSESSGFVTSLLDLSALAGQNVQFRFRLALVPAPGVGFGSGFGWAIDDVRLYQCGDEPSPTLSIDDVTVREGATYAVFTVSLSAPLNSDVTVQYVTSDITASAGSDYSATSGTLTIPAGQTSATISVSIGDDSIPEPTRTFQITLSNATHATIARGTGIGAILDDDSTPSPPTSSTWAVAQQGMPILHAVAYGAGRYVSVGDSGQVWTSPDGANWSKRPDPLAGTAVAIAYGGGQFAAAGQQLVVTSADGLTWTDHSSTLPSGFTPRGITFGGGTWVVVGWNGNIFTSADGGTWLAADSGTTIELDDVAYGDGRFVAVGGTILTSTDAVHWTTPAQLPAVWLSAVTYDGTQFVAMSNNSAWTSPDGSSWSGNRLDNHQYQDVTLGPGPTLVAVGQGAVATSTDGATWEQRMLPKGLGGARNLLAIAHGRSAYVAVGTNGAVFTSADGVTWTSRQLPASRNFAGVAFDGIRFCAIGAYGAAASSADGITWTNATTPPPAPGDDYGQLNAITWAANLFVAVGDAILTSPDCRTWTSRPPSWARTTWSTRLPLKDVAYGAGRYVAVGNQYVNGTQVAAIQASTDGTHWSEVEVPGVPVAPLLSVAYGAGRFLIVGQPFSGGRRFLLASEDGVHWTRVPAEIGEDPYQAPPARLRYANGTFVLVAKGDTGWTSTDGTAWMADDIGAWGLRDVTYGSSRFVGVGD